MDSTRTRFFTSRGRLRSKQTERLRRREYKAEKSWSREFLVDCVNFLLKGLPTWNDINADYSFSSMNTTVAPPVTSSRNPPQLDDLLKDVAPYPYTLKMFKGYLARNHCTEFLDFIMDLAEYSKMYESAYGKKEPPISQSEESKHLISLWLGLVSVYINPGSSSELNLSGKEREQLLQYKDGIIPPPPTFIEGVVKREHESFQSSTFVSFLNSRPQLNDAQWAGSRHIKVASDISMPSLKESSSAHPSFYNPPAPLQEDCVSPSSDTVREMPVCTTAKKTSSEHSLAPSDLEPRLTRNAEVQKGWRLGAKRAFRRIFRQHQ